MAAPTLGTGVLPTSWANAMAAYVDQVESKIPRIAYKSSDEIVNNSAVFQNDEELLMSLAASARFRFFCRLLYNSGTTPDLKFQWTYPSGTTMLYTGLCTVAGAFNQFQFTEAAGGSIDGVAANTAALLFGTITTSSTPGTLTLQWAQNTANASDTTLRAGSFLEVVRIS